MKSCLPLIIATLGALGSCVVDPEINEEAVNAPLPVENLVAEPPQDVSVPVTAYVEDEPAIETPEPVAITKPVISEEAVMIRQNVKVSKEQIDSMMVEAPFYDPGEYAELAVEMNFSLAKKTGGVLHLAEDAEAVVSSIFDIIDDYVYSGSDLVFVMDNTYSMWDDMEQVKSSLNKIIDKVEELDGVKLGMATFTDKNWHAGFWYNSMDLTDDHEAVREFLNGTVIMANNDIPESANDAVMRTIEEMSWTPGNKRVMILVGDAPSLEPPRSDYSMEDVIRACSEADIAINVHPVVIRIDQVFKSEMEKRTQDIIRNLYPNPASAGCTLGFYGPGEYHVEVFSDARQKVMENNCTGPIVRMDFSSLAPGMYMVKAHDKITGHVGAQLLAVVR